MDIIYGINPIMESLRDESTRVRKIIIARGKTGPGLAIITDLAVGQGIPVLYDDRSAINGLAPDVSHQGIVALCRPYKYRSVDEIIANHPGSMKNNLILILDNITDPHNLGSIIRTAHCFGANGVIIPKNRAAEVTPTVVKASAGAANHTPVAIVTNLAQTITHLKEKGFWIYGADGRLGQDIATFQDLGDVALIMGSEGEGIRPLVRRSCDYLVSVPLYGKIDSLNVSVATGIILHEILAKSKRG